MNLSPNSSQCRKPWEWNLYSFWGHSIVLGEEEKKELRGCYGDLINSSVKCLLLLSRISRVWLCNPINGSPTGSSVPGILQARILECVAISFSNAWKWKVKVKSLGFVRLLATPWTAAYQAPPSMGFSWQEYWSGLPLPSPVKCLVPTKYCI